MAHAIDSRFWSRFSRLAVVCTVVLAPLTAAADIYQWTDADGVVHFTNKPSGNPTAKVYLKGAPGGTGGSSTGPSGAVTTTPGVRAGVTPWAPQDRDPSRYTRYDETIRHAALLYQIPEPLIRAIIKCESDYDPRAVSPAGARGLMQLMPETAERMQVKDINDPRENIYGGVRYLRILANLFNGDLELTVAGYNAGEQAVINYAGIPPYAETRGYVVKVTKYYRRYRTIPDANEASMWVADPPAQPPSVVGYGPGGGGGNTPGATSVSAGGTVTIVTTPP